MMGQFAATINKRQLDGCGKWNVELLVNNRVTYPLAFQTVRFAWRSAHS